MLVPRTGEVAQEKTYVQTGTRVRTAALFSTDRKRKQTQRSPAGEWIRGTWGVHTVDTCSITDGLETPCYVREARHERPRRK